MTIQPKRSKAITAAKPAPAETPVNPLDQEPYLSMFAETRASALKVLEEYGEPTMSLEELRALLKAQLDEKSLSVQLMEDREASW